MHRAPLSVSLATNETFQIYLLSPTSHATSLESVELVVDGDDGDLLPVGLHVQLEVLADVDQEHAELSLLRHPQDQLVEAVHDGGQAALHLHDGHILSREDYKCQFIIITLIDI